VGTDTLTVTYTPDVAGEAAFNTATGTGTVTVTAVSLVPCKLQGYKAQLGYVPPAGGALVIVAGLKEVDGGFTAEELDSTDHGSGGWKQRMYGLLDFSGTAKLDYIAGDASQEALLAAILNKTPLTITMFPTQSSGSGVDSYIGPVVLGDFKWDGKNTDLQGVSITLKGAGAFSVAAQ
jgi:predicted secreted protein